MDLITNTPAHAFQNHPRLNKNYRAKNDSKYDIGSLAHSIFLEGKDKSVLIDADDWRTKAAKEARDRARAEGKIPMLTRDSGKVNAMVLAARQALAESELGITNLQKDGRSEVSYFWKEGGVWCRTRLDWISNDSEIVIDYKTTGTSANPAYFGRNIAQFGYDIQDGLYRRSVTATDGKDPKFFFLVQEDEPPFMCSLISLSPQFREIGWQKASAGIEMWRRCLTTGEWPGYPNRVCYIEPPPWVATAWEEQRFSIQFEHEEEQWASFSEGQ